MTLKRDVEAAKVISNLFAEVFQRRRVSDQVLALSNTPDDIVVVTEHRAWGLLMTDTNDHVWGPGGPSSETNSSGASGRWGEAAWG